MRTKYQLLCRRIYRQKVFHLSAERIRFDRMLFLDIRKGETMSLFDSFLVAHLVGDWLLQTAWQAEGKVRGRFLNAPLLVHCTVYTLSFVPVFLWHTLPLWGLVVLWGTHVFLDRRFPVVWLVKLREGKHGDLSYTPPAWLVIVVDQVVHLLVCAALVVCL